MHTTKIKGILKIKGKLPNSSDMTNLLEYMNINHINKATINIEITKNDIEKRYVYVRRKKK